GKSLAGLTSTPAGPLSELESIHRSGPARTTKEMAASTYSTRRSAPVRPRRALLARRARSPGALLGALLIGSITEHPQLQEREDEDDGEQRHRQGRGVAELEELERLPVDVVDRRGGRVGRPPVGHDEDGVEQLERGDERDQQHEYAGPVEQWQRDVPEAPERPGAVDARGLVVDGGDVLQPGQKDDHAVA